MHLRMLCTAFEFSIHMLNSFYRQVYVFLPVGKAYIFEVAVAYSHFPPLMSTVCVTT